MLRKQNEVASRTIRVVPRLKSSQGVRNFNFLSWFILFVCIVFGHRALSADADCYIPEYVNGPTHFGPITDVFYGAKTTDDSVFLVCGGSWGMQHEWEMVRDRIMPLQRICTIPLRDGMTIGIYGNNNNNQIHSVGQDYVFRCDDYELLGWDGLSGSFALWEEYLGPPIASWNVGELLIVGNGGDDVIGGIQVGDIPNRIFGDFAGRQLTAPEGFDVLYGGPGSDKIYGEGLDDVIHGGTGDDVLVGGNDSGCSTRLQRDEDLIFGEEGNDFIYGDAGYDERCGFPLCGSGVDPDFRPSEEYRPEADVLVGGDGGDHIFGGPGDDLLVGDWFDIRLDTKDILCGGPGRDGFDADSPDLVSYETNGEPVIQEHLRFGLHENPSLRVDPITDECAWDEFCPVIGP